jgi:hypothetical protein
MEAMLHEFRTEMAELPEAEEREGNTAHFMIQNTRERNPHFDPWVLTSADMEIWKKVGDGSITQKEVQEYQNSFEGLDESDPVNASRMIFCKFVANKSQRPIAMKVLPQLKKKS